MAMRTMVMIVMMMMMMIVNCDDGDGNDDDDDDHDEYKKNGDYSYDDGFDSAIIDLALPIFLSIIVIYFIVHHVKTSFSSYNCQM